MLPSLSLAVTLSVTLAGAVKVVPSIGVTQVAVGAAFTTGAIESETVVFNAAALSARDARQGKWPWDRRCSASGMG